MVFSRIRLSVAILHQQLLSLVYGLEKKCERKILKTDYILRTKLIDPYACTQFSYNVVKWVQIVSYLSRLRIL